MRRLSENERRFLRRLLERQRNNNNSPSPRRERRSGGRAEKTKYLNEQMRRVYKNTGSNRHFVYTGPNNRPKVRTYTEIFAFKNDWNQIRRLRGSGAGRTSTSSRYRTTTTRRGNYRRRY